MKRTANLVSVLVVFMCVSCSGPTPPKETESAQKNATFYPVSSFIIQQVKLVDSLPLAVFKYTTIAGRADSVIITKEEFKNAAAEFLSPDITDSALRDLYEETTFFDATINTVTLTYTTKDREAVIRKVDVLVNPDNEKVKNIYIEKQINNSDSSVTRKLLWKANRNFEVISIVRETGKPEKIRQEKYVWDFEK